MTPVRGVMAGGACYVSIPDACRLYHVSRRTLYNWMDNGKVLYAHSPGGARYVLLSSLAMTLPTGEKVALDVPVSRYEFLDVR